MNGMENKKPILTISIPTYNRPQEIQKQVRLILPQLNEEVILIVYDNCSEHNVADLFTEEEKKLFQIKRNSLNIGGDANIARCFEKCETDWLWTLSDDDYVKPNSIDKILEYIKNNKDCIFINFWSYQEGKTLNFKEFAQRMSNRGMFTAAFAMSTCLYNWKLLKYDIQYYYKYLSAMLGTLIMVSKNIERTNNKCFFIYDCFVELGSDVGWNYRDYIYSSSLFLEAFRKGRNPNVNYNNTLLSGYHKTNYKLIEINRKSSNIKYWQRLSLWLKAVNIQGCLNALIYNPKECFSALLYSLINFDSITFNKIINKAIQQLPAPIFSCLKKIKKLITKK